MPPKTSSQLPNIIFVSDERSGALFHSSKIEDITDLVIEHIKTKVFLEPLPEVIPEDTSPWIYEFAMIQINCDASLRFTKGSHIYYPSLVLEFIQSNLSTYWETIPPQPILEFSSQLPSFLLELRKKLMNEIEERISHVFDS
jgi:hypothetical protein